MDDAGKTIHAQNVDTLGNQLISNEVAVISMLQVLAQAQPAIAQALARAMRESNERVPHAFQDVRDRIGQYVNVIENRNTD